MAEVDVGSLTPLQVTKLKKPGHYRDSPNLFLAISPRGGRSWLFKYMFDGVAHGMGLGPVHTIKLGEARSTARDLRKQLLAGIDPLSARNAARDAEREAAKAAELTEAQKAITFRLATAEYVEGHHEGWSNKSYAASWEAELEAHIFPTLGDVSVAEIDTALVLKALEPIWVRKFATARRLRGRVETILDWCAGKGYRPSTEPNPARWKGCLKNLLLAPKKLKRARPTQHHPALPYSELPTFMTVLRQQKDTARLALEFVVLTCTRSVETREARWPEIDEQSATWLIPGHRYKTGKPLRVPLSAAAMAIIAEMKQRRVSEFVFPGAFDRPQAHTVMRELMRKLHPVATVHGMRSTFRDWAAECTNFPREVCEQALGHSIGDAVAAAYMRSDLFVRRRLLMEAWAEFIEAPKRNAEVVPLQMKRKRR